MHPKSILNIGADVLVRMAHPTALQQALAELRTFVAHHFQPLNIYASMKPVVQEEISGCGIASVATLAGVAYREAKAAANKLGIFAEDRNLWSDTRHVRTLLEHFGISAGEEEKPFSSWEELPELALLSIKWHLEGGRPFWHWVVCLRSANGLVVFDPKKVLKTNERKDFGRMKPKWFIPIKALPDIAVKRGARQAVHSLRLP